MLSIIIVLMADHTCAQGYVPDYNKTCKLNPRLYNYKVYHILGYAIIIIINVRVHVHKIGD